MNRRIGGLLPYLMTGVFVFIIAAASGTTVYADPISQHGYVDVVGCDPVDRNSRIFDSLPVTNEITVGQNGDVGVERMIDDPNQIVVQPIRDFVPNGVVVATPEPATMLLLGTGLAGAAGVVRRRHMRKTN